MNRARGSTTGAAAQRLADPPLYRPRRRIRLLRRSRRGPRQRHAIRHARRRTRPSPGPVLVRTALAAFGLTADPALEEIGRIVHDADLADERYDAPAAPGL